MITKTGKPTDKYHSNLIISNVSDIIVANKVDITINILFIHILKTPIRSVLQTEILWPEKKENNKKAIQNGECSQ